MERSDKYLIIHFHKWTENMAEANSQKESYKTIYLPNQPWVVSILVQYTGNFSKNWQNDWKRSSCVYKRCGNVAFCEQRWIYEQWAREEGETAEDR